VPSKPQAAAPRFQDEWSEKKEHPQELVEDTESVSALVAQYEWHHTSGHANANLGCVLQVKWRDEDDD
jgi:hypothetical protein